MGSAVKKVTGAAKKVAGTFLGGGGSPGALGTGRFQGSGRNIRSGAFQIEGAKSAAKRAGKEEALARSRSKQAAEQRSRLITQLEEQSRGEGPSLAEAQMKAAQDRSLAQQLAAAQQRRGGNQAALARQLAQQQAASGQQIAQEAGQARIQEQQQAQQMLAQATQADTQLYNNAVAQYMNMGFNIQQARQQAQQDLETAKTQQHLAVQGLSASGFEGAAERRQGMIGQAGQGLGSAIALMRSDKNSKTKIKKASSKSMAKALSSEETKKDKKELSSSNSIDPSKFLEQASKKVEEGKKDNKSSGPDASSLAGLAAALSDSMSKKDKSKLKKEFLDKLTAYEYEYKDEFKDHPFAGKGKHVSVMAQDLEKAGPIGKSMVNEDESGTKIVDYGKGFGAILAAQALLNERLNKLEKKKK